MLNFDKLTLDQHLDLLGIPFLSNGQLGIVIDAGHSLTINGKPLQKIEGCALDPHKHGGYGHRCIAFASPDGRRHVFFGETFAELTRVCSAISAELARFDQLKVSYICSCAGGLSVFVCNGKSDPSAEFVLSPILLRAEFRDLAPHIAAAAAVLLLNLLPDHRLVLRTPRANKPLFEPSVAPLCA